MDLSRRNVMANREQRPNREKKKPKQPKPSPAPGKPLPWK
jgi:hypothetical protein